MDAGDAGEKEEGSGEFVGNTSGRTRTRHITMMMMMRRSRRIRKNLQDIALLELSVATSWENSTGSRCTIPWVGGWLGVSKGWVAAKSLIFTLPNP